MGTRSRLILFLALIFCNYPINNAFGDMPDYFSEPGINPHREYLSPLPFEAIDPFNGNLHLSFVDIALPGNGSQFDLKVIRTYDSNSISVKNPASTEHHSLGLGWRTHFGRIVKNKDYFFCYKNSTAVADNPVLELPDGSIQQLAFTNQPDVLISSSRWKAVCNGSANVSVYSPDGMQFDMTRLVSVGTNTAPGYALYTTRITDKKGNYAKLSYAEGHGAELLNITTNDGRSISFNYLDAGTPTSRIGTIKDSLGHTCRYTYKAIAGLPNQHYLTAVTVLDGSDWHFSYNNKLANDTAGSFLLSQLTTPLHKSIAYNYRYVNFDAYQANGNEIAAIRTRIDETGNRWAVNYFPGQLGVYDSTTVNTPAETISYEHIGPNYAASGFVWMIGLLISTKTEAFEARNIWACETIAYESNFRRGAFVDRMDSFFNAPLLSEKVFTLNEHDPNAGKSDRYGNLMSLSNR